jgi:glycosyltransferase involved in cell wall biosynthesis
MRIAHITATYPPYSGGTGRICADQASELCRRGHQVTVYCPSPDRRRSVEAGPPQVVRLPVWLRIGNAALVPGHLGTPRPDLVHLHYPYYGGGDLAWLGAQVRRIPYVVTYHQDVVMPGAIGIVARRHHAIAGRRILAGARLVMATSLDYARHSRLAPLLSLRNVVALPNGVDTLRFYPAPAANDFRAAHGISDGERVILFVGSLDSAHYFKGVDVLLHAFALLRDPPVRLLIIGRGDLRPQYQAQAATLGIKDRVCFDDAVTDAELPAHYRLADVLVLPSTTRGEAFGVVLLEAMAGAAPVVASDLPGVRSVVTRTGGGLLTPPGDAKALAAALRLLLSDERLRRDMGQRGRAGVEHLYAWPKIIDELEALYRRALAGDGPRDERHGVPH